MPESLPAITVPEPLLPLTTTGEVRNLNTAEADALARELGLRRISGIKLKAATELGEHLSRLGVLKIGRGRYLISMDRLDVLAEKLVEMISEVPTGAVENVCSLGESLRATEKALVEVSREMVEAEKNLTTLTPVLPQLAPPPTPITLNNVIVAHQQKSILPPP